MLFSKTRVLIKYMQMSSETGIQDVCVLIKDMQMSSETGIQEVRVLIAGIVKIIVSQGKRIDFRINGISENLSFRKIN